MIRIYKTTKGLIGETNGQIYSLEDITIDSLLTLKDPYETVAKEFKGKESTGNENVLTTFHLLAPIDSQEVWAAGVTYLRSRDARIEESKDAGGGNFYDKVYVAERPEVFFKATPHRCVGTNEKVRIRKDSKWNVPEPELTLVLNKYGKIVGYTIGNDMSSRSIEAENPLYLPQAKTYDGSAGLGPCICLSQNSIPSNTVITMTINRGGKNSYEDRVEISQMKRTHSELVEFLFRECSFPNGAFLMTGTCLVPPDEFTLQKDDEINITIDHIGTLKNYVA